MGRLKAVKDKGAEKWKLVGGKSISYDDGVDGECHLLDGQSQFQMAKCDEKREEGKQL